MDAPAYWTPTPSGPTARERLVADLEAPLPAGAIDRLGRASAFGPAVGPLETRATGTKRRRPSLPSQLVAIGADRWAVSTYDRSWVDRTWVVYDPALGEVARVAATSQHQVPTPDGAWLLGPDGAVPVDPGRVVGVRRAASRGRASAELLWSRHAAISIRRRPARPPDACTDDSWWSGDGGVVACRIDGNLAVLRRSGERVATWPGEPLDPAGVSFSSDASVLAITGTRGEIAAWSLDEGTHWLRAAPATATPEAVVTGDGSLVVVMFARRTALLDAATAERLDAPGPATPQTVARIELGEDGIVETFDRNERVIDRWIDGRPQLVPQDERRVRPREEAGWLVPPNSTVLRSSDGAREISLAEAIHPSRGLGRVHSVTRAGDWVLVRASRSVIVNVVSGVAHASRSNGVLDARGSTWAISGAALERMNAAGRPMTGIHVGRPVTAFAIDGDRVATSHQDGTVLLWESPDRSALDAPARPSVVTPAPTSLPLDEPIEGPAALAMSEDGSGIALVDGDGRIALYAVATGRRLWRTGPFGPLDRIVFARDGGVVAVGDRRFVHLDREGTPLEVRSWPWRRAEGVRIADDGAAAVLEDRRWHEIRSSSGVVIGEEDAPISLWDDTRRPDRVRFRFPGYAAKRAPPGLRCPPGGTVDCGAVHLGRRRGSTADEVEQLYPSPDGLRRIEVDGTTLPSLVDPDGERRPADKVYWRRDDVQVAWTDPHTAVVAASGLVGRWKVGGASEVVETDHLPLTGFAVGGDRTVRLGGGVALVGRLGSPVVDCLFPAEGELAAVSPNGRYGTWFASGPVIADLETCELVLPASPRPEPHREWWRPEDDPLRGVPIRALLLPSGSALVDGDTMRAYWSLIRWSSEGLVRESAPSLGGRLAGIDPTGSRLVISGERGSELWSLAPLERVEILDPDVYVDAVAPDGTLAAVGRDVILRRPGGPWIRVDGTRDALGATLAPGGALVVATRDAIEVREPTALDGPATDPPDRSLLRLRARRRVRR